MKNPKYMTIEEIHNYVKSLAKQPHNQLLFLGLEKYNNRLQKKTYLKIIEAWKEHELPKLQSMNKI